VAKVILNDFYIDDLLRGADTVEDAMSIAKRVNDVLGRGCFPLRKWTSNDRRVIRDLPSGDSCRGDVSFGDDSVLKTLGLFWNPRDDRLFYSVREGEQACTTKRYILSEISRIFDPLGMIGPVIVIAKIMIQRLWRQGVSWDESIPCALYSEWIEFRNGLQFLSDITIPRRAVRGEVAYFELHGFVDASKFAYGACIYVRFIDSSRRHCVRLLCSKSRVAPLKSLIIPRLEICAALILAKLMSKVNSALAVTTGVLLRTR